ncbi:MAG: TYR-PHOSPHATASE-2 domain-containing protein [Clostridium sp.]
MRKSIKKVALFLLMIMTISLSLLPNTAIKAQAVDTQEDVNLVVDLVHDVNELPKNFRKTTNLAVIENNKEINLTGLDKLNISGSSEFSVNNLPMLIDAIGTSLPITVIDLRQESHGFINEYAVSWADKKNNANVGLTREQVLKKEAQQLNSIKLNKPITFYNHPKLTVIPTKVQDEDKLVKSKGLSYKRVTVRDGGIPTDDMVDYFVDIIKNQPKDSWLHFHCKEGIGRTSTFMIMYDMMRNHKSLSADEIIKRQLALANYKESTVQSFYNKERIGFLNKFYEYCKANGDNFDTKWSQWTKAADNSAAFSINSFNTSSSYIKNPVMPKNLYVVSLDSMKSSEKTLISSLQGIVNGRSFSQIYTLSSSHPDYNIWLEDLKDNYNVSYTMISDPWELIKIYKNYINGYVLYKRKSPKDPSINNACSLASLNNAIVVEESIEDKVKLYGIKKVIGDCRNTDESWAYENLWNKGLNHSMVIQLSPDKAAPLRDYAIMTKSLVFYESDINKTDFRSKVFSSMKGNAVCLGWGPDEFINVSTASKYGVSVVAADWSYNLTTLSAFPLKSIPKKASPSIMKEDNVHYVTFLMSDGDNQQWNLGNNYSVYKWFGNPNRDSLNLGWSMSPSLYYLSPTVFQMYYKSISNEKAENNFIVPPSGNGYIFPSKFDKSKLGSFINELNNYMGQVNEKYVAIIDDSSFYDVSLWDKFTLKSNIDGLFYLDYSRHDKFQGKIIWSNNKPIVSCRDLLWNNLESEDELVKRINDRVDLGEIDVKKPSAYTFVYVHVWSKGVPNVEEVVNRLKQNSKVRIVTPEMFMELIRNNIEH